MDDVKLQPCARCSGQPVVLILPLWPHPALRVECPACGMRGTTIYFDEEAPIFQGTKKMLPGLGKARRQAAAAWNEEAGGHD